MTPGSTSSAAAPCRKAITGVPLTIASTIAMPKGSSHWMGKISARAFARSCAFSLPFTFSRQTTWPLRFGLILSSK